MSAEEKSKRRRLLLLLFPRGETLSRWVRLLFGRGNMSSLSIREEESSNTDEENRLVFYHASRSTTERLEGIWRKEGDGRRDTEKETKRHARTEKRAEEETLYIYRDYLHPLQDFRVEIADDGRDANDQGYPPTR